MDNLPNSLTKLELPSVYSGPFTRKFNNLTHLTFMLYNASQIVDNNLFPKLRSLCVHERYYGSIDNFVFPQSLRELKIILNMPNGRARR